MPINSQSSIAFEVPAKKSPALAILYSVLLPGMGELYAGAYESGVYFTAADAVFWGTFAGFNIYGAWQRNNYKSFAQSNGGVTLINKDEDFFADIGLYTSIDEFNREKEFNREFDKMYNPETHYWNWGSDVQRRA